MANPKTPKNKAIKSDKIKQRNFIISMIVVVTMIFSGLYYLSFAANPSTQTPDTTNVPVINFNSYTVTPYISGKPVMVKVENTKKQYIAMPKSQCLSPQVIGWVYNISVPGISGVIMDAANPAKSGEAICGQAYLLFRFGISSPTTETLNSLQTELNNRLGEYFLEQVYDGTILNGSGIEPAKIDVIGNLDVAVGDTVEVIIFQKDNGAAIALEKRKIYYGPTVPGKVLGVSDLIVRGTINDSFNESNLGKQVNLTDMRIYAPKLSVYLNLSENLSSEITNITGVTVSRPAPNVTEIDYNNSKDKVLGILSREKINQTFVNGSAILQFQVNESIPKVKQILEARGLVDLEFKNSGQVELPDEVMFNSNLASIPNAANYTVILELKTKAGDMINVTLSAMQFGDQIFIAGASQAKA